MNSYDKVLSFQNDYYKELYEDGIRQRNQINSKFVPTITLLTAEVSGIIWVVSKLFSNVKANDNIVHLVDLCVFTSVIITFILWLLATIYFALCFTNYHFKYPKPDEIKEFIEANKSRLGEYTEQEILNNIHDVISNGYIEMAISNCEETNKHCKHLNKCYIFLVITLPLLIISFVFTLFL